MAESFSREKLRHASQKKGGWIKITVSSGSYREKQKSIGFIVIIYKEVSVNHRLKCPTGGERLNR